MYIENNIEINSNIDLCLCKKFDIIKENKVLLVFRVKFLFRLT